MQLIRTDGSILPFSQDITTIEHTADFEEKLQVKLYALNNRYSGEYVYVTMNFNSETEIKSVYINPYSTKVVYFDITVPDYEGDDEHKDDLEYDIKGTLSEQDWTVADEKPEKFIAFTGITPGITILTGVLPAATKRITNKKSSNKIKISHKKDGKWVEVKDDEILMEGNKYKLESKTKYIGVSASDDTSFSVDINISDKLLKRIDLKVKDGTMGNIGAKKIRKFDISHEFTLTSEYIKDEKAVFKVLWDSFNKIKELTKKNNLYTRSFSVKEFQYDLAITNITIKNASETELYGIRLGEDKDDLTINVSYANLGGKNFTDKVTVELKIDTPDSTKSLKKITLDSLEAKETGSFKIDWKATLTNCPYGLCNFTATITEGKDDSNKKNNNLTRKFALIKIYDLELTGYIPFYYSQLNKKVVRRKTDYTLSVEFIGPRIDLLIQQGGDTELVGLDWFEHTIGKIEHKDNKRYINYTIKNTKINPVGKYNASLGVFYDKPNDIEGENELENITEYFVIFNSDIAGTERTSYMVDDNYNVKTSNSNRFHYTMGAVYTLAPNEVSWYEKKITVGPVTNIIFDRAIEAVNGEKTIKNGADRINQVIGHIFNYSLSIHHSNPPQGYVEDIPVKYFVKNRNDQGIVSYLSVPDNLKVQGKCLHYSYFSIAFLRSIGIPSRDITGGYQTVVVIDGHDVWGHAWIEYYLPTNGEKWQVLGSTGNHNGNRKGQYLPRYKGIATAKADWKDDAGNKPVITINRNTGEAKITNINEAKDWELLTDEYKK